MDLASIEGTCLLKAFLYIVMYHFSCSNAKGSKEVREDHYDNKVKHLFQCFVIFPYGIDSIFLDRLMHHIIEIIKILKTKCQYKKKFLTMTSLLPSCGAGPMFLCFNRCIYKYNLFVL